MKKTEIDLFEKRKKEKKERKQNEENTIFRKNRAVIAR